jgi:hypothetical protein
MLQTKIGDPPLVGSFVEDDKKFSFLAFLTPKRGQLKLHVKI